MAKLTYKEKYEAYRARIDSESYHKLTPEQEKQGEENRRKLAEYYKKHEKKLINNISKNKVELYITNPRGYTLKTVETCNDEHKKYILN